MNKYLIIVLLLLGACCKDSIELNRYLLTDTEKSFISYSNNQKVRFVHSNGFEFDINVSNITISLERTKTEHCGENYVSFENKLVNLQSNTPELYINISIVPFEYYNDNISISVNNYFFVSKSINSAPDIDTLKLGDRIFLDVYEFTNEYYDPAIICPEIVFFNKNVGIIQIKMTNDETFTITD